MIQGLINEIKNLSAAGTTLPVALRSENFLERLGQALTEKSAGNNDKMDLDQFMAVVFVTAWAVGVADEDEDAIAPVEAWALAVWVR